MTKRGMSETDPRLLGSVANMRRAGSSVPFLIRSHAPFPVGLDDAPAQKGPHPKSNGESATHDPRHAPSKLVVLSK